MQESKFYLTVSRFESFGLASTEAGCCGCVVFAPRSLFSAWPPAEKLPTKAKLSSLAGFGVFAKRGSNFTLPTDLAFIPVQVAKAFLAFDPT
jgi:hypothetical protein